MISTSYVFEALEGQPQTNPPNKKLEVTIASDIQFERRAEARAWMQGRELASCKNLGSRGLVVYRVASLLRCLSTRRSWIQQAEKKGIVKGAQQIMGYLAKTGLVSQQIPAEHPLNRDGYGVNPRDVHSLVSGIASVRFDAGQTHPICTEILPSDTELVSFNQALADGSNGLLPPMANCMRYASLANSHTNAALRCILASVPHDDPDLCTHGHLSLGVIRQKDSSNTAGQL